MSNESHDSLLDSKVYKLAEPGYGRGKKIRIWENGNYTKFEKTLIINPNQCKSWIAVLNFITEKFQASFGVVLYLVSFTTKKPIYTFEDMENNGRYIALGKSKLEMNEPGYISWSQHLLDCTKRNIEHYIRLRREEFPNFLIEAAKKRYLVTYIFVNGYLNKPPMKIVLTTEDLKNWPTTLRYLSYRLEVPHGVEYLATVYGDMVCNPLELQNGCIYVAIAFQEKFKKFNYLEVFNENSTQKKRSRYTLTLEKGKKPTCKGLIKCPNAYRTCLDANKAANVQHAKRKLHIDLKKELTFIVEDKVFREKEKEETTDDEVRTREKTFLADETKQAKKDWSARQTQTSLTIVPTMTIVNDNLITIGSKEYIKAEKQVPNDGNVLELFKSDSEFVSTAASESSPSTDFFKSEPTTSESRVDVDSDYQERREDWNELNKPNIIVEPIPKLEHSLVDVQDLIKSDIIDHLTKKIKIYNTDEESDFSQKFVAGPPETRGVKLTNKNEVSNEFGLPKRGSLNQKARTSVPENVGTLLNMGQLKETSLPTAKTILSNDKSLDKSDPPVKNEVNNGFGLPKRGSLNQKTRTSVPENVGTLLNMGHPNETSLPIAKTILSNDKSLDKSDPPVKNGVNNEYGLPKRGSLNQKARTSVPENVGTLLNMGHPKDTSLPIAKTILSNDKSLDKSDPPVKIESASKVAFAQPIRTSVPETVGALMNMEHLTKSDLPNTESNIYETSMEIDPFNAEVANKVSRLSELTSFIKEIPSASHTLEPIDEDLENNLSESEMKKLDHTSLYLITNKDKAQANDEIVENRIANTLESLDELIKIPDNFEVIEDIEQVLKRSLIDVDDIVNSQFLNAQSVEAKDPDATNKLEVIDDILRRTLASVDEIVMSHTAQEIEKHEKLLKPQREVTFVNKNNGKSKRASSDSVNRNKKL